MNDYQKSPDQVATEAKQVGQDAVNKAKGLASDAKHVVDDAVDAGRAYAQDAVNEAGKKIRGVKAQAAQTADYLTEAIHQDRVRAVLVTAVISSVLTALVVSSLRSDRHYF
jgi:RES domain-containing protein